MGQILRQLYYGEVLPLEGLSSLNPDYLAKRIQLDEQFAAMKDALVDMLDERGQKLLDDLLDLRTRVDSFMGVEDFAKGFRLGALIMKEILNDAQ